MYFQQNIDAILKQNPWQKDMVAKLKDVEPTTGAELYETEDGHYSLRYKNVFLHDLKSPIEEARKAIRTITTMRPDKVQVIVGIGLGYMLQELFEASEGKVVVYEPDLALLRFVLDNVGLVEYLDTQRVWLATDMQELELAVKHQMIGEFEVDIVGLKSSSVLYAEQLSVLTEEMQKWYKVSRMDTITIKRYYMSWVTEMLRNSPHFAHMRNVGELFGKYAGKPALVISSGPSLDKAIDAVKELADSTVLVSVGGALRRLHQAGVAPDFALFYDVLGMKEQFHGLPQEYLDKIIFVMCPFSQYECFEAPVRAKMLFHSNNIAPVVQWIENTLQEPHERIGGGATVSVVGFQMAVAMKCDPVILIGQDLAFPNNQVYAGGIMMKTDGRGNLTLDGNDDLYAEAAPMAEVKGQNGEMLPTLATYALFLKAFEDMSAYLEKMKDPTRLYNASIGGAAIEGYALKPLSEFVGQFENWKNPFAVPGDLSLPEDLIEQRRALLRTGLAQFRTGVEKAVSICSRMQRDLNAISPRDLLAGNTDQSIKKMRDLNKRFNGVLQSHPLVEFLLTMETFDYKQAFMHKLESPDVVPVWHAAMKKLVTNSLKGLKEEILPTIQQAEQELQEDKLPQPTAIAR
ncbi:MAG TPA: 6-hydroxymethylpterin diphosphokinase MptE-like protein [Coleofasciculaceae cyanobacterium]|jgi:hypothetical protein